MHSSATELLALYPNNSSWTTGLKSLQGNEQLLPSAAICNDPFRLQPLNCSSDVETPIPPPPSLSGHGTQSFCKAFSSRTRVALLDRLHKTPTERPFRLNS